MTSPTNKIDIVVGPFPTDAALWKIKGVPTLMLREGQSFSSARDNVRNVLPGITVEAVERMLQEQCPEFRNLDDLLGLNTPVPPSVERTPVEKAADDAPTGLLSSKRRRHLVMVAALLPALTASWALGRYVPFGDDAPSARPAAAASDSRSASPGPGTVGTPFRDSRFEFFAGSSNIECSTVSPLAAECTDADGMVMSTKAATGPDSTIFTFSYGSERVGLRVFYDAEYADTWERQDGSRGMYPNLKRHGRYVLWGTDTSRINAYKELLEEADRDRRRGAATAAMVGPTPLPPRLVALTLGTLGISSDAVRNMIANVSAAFDDGPAVMAARLVLGLDSLPRRYDPAGEDIVALAAGIEPPVEEQPLPTEQPPAAEPPTAAKTFPPAPVPSTAPPTSPPTSPDPSPAPSTPVTPSLPTPTPTPTPTPPPTTAPTPSLPPPTTAPTPSPPPTGTPAPTPEEPAPSVPTPPPASETPTPDPGDGEPTPGQEPPAPPVEETLPVDTPAEDDEPQDGSTPVAAPWDRQEDVLPVLNSDRTTAA